MQQLQKNYRKKIVVVLIFTLMGLILTTTYNTDARYSGRTKEKNQEFVIFGLKIVASSWGGGIKINKKGEITVEAKGLNIQSTDSIVKIYAEDVKLKIGLLSILRLHFIPKIEQIKNATVRIDATNSKKQTNISTRKDIKRILHIFEDFIVQTLQNKDDSNAKKESKTIKIVENIKVFISLKNNKEVNFAINNAIISPISAIENITKNSFSQSKPFISLSNIINGEATLNGKIINFLLACEERLVGNLCKISVNNISLNFLNKITNNKESKALINFSQIIVDADMIFGTHVSNNKLSVFVKHKKTGRMEFINKDSVEIRPFSGKVMFDIDNMSIEIPKFQFEATELADISLAINTNFIAKTGQEKIRVAFSTGNIKWQDALRSLNVVSFITPGMKDIIDGIMKNVELNGGTISITDAEIIKSVDEPIEVNIGIKAEKASINITQLKNMLVRSITADVRIKTTDTNITCRSAKIGNEFFEEAIIDITYGNITPKMNTSISFKSIDLMAMILNPSSPQVIQNIATHLGINNGATISGKTNFYINLLPEIETQNGFSIQGSLYLTNVNSRFIRTNKNGITIDFINKIGSNAIDIVANCSDALISIGENVIVKESNKQMTISTTLRDILLKQNKWVYSDSIKVTENKKELANGSIAIKPGDSFERSKIKADFSVFQLIGNDLLFNVQKKIGHQYNFNLEGDKADFRTIKNTWKYFIKPYSAPIETNEISIKGKGSVKRLEMFNGVIGSGMIFNIDMSDAVVQDANLSVGLSRTTDSSTQEHQEHKANNTANQKKEKTIKSLLSGKDRKKWTQLIKTHPTLFETNTNEFSAGDSILAIISKNKTENKNTVYANITNARMVIDGLGLSGVFKRFGEGKISIEAKQTEEKSILGQAIVANAIYYPDDDFNGDISKVNIQKVALIDAMLMYFDYNMIRKILKMQETNLRTNLISVDWSGYIDFKLRNIYIDGKFKIYTLRAKDFGLENIPIFGNTLASGKNNTGLEFSFVIDADTEMIEDAEMSIRPSQQLFWGITAGTVIIIGTTIGLLVGLL